MLVESRAKLLVCADAECPGAVRDFCRALLTEVEDQLPTLVIAVEDETGVLIAATVELDGVPLAALDNAPIDVNPGLHRLVATAPGYEAAHANVAVPQGMRRTPVLLTLRRAPIVVAGPAVALTGEQSGLAASAPVTGWRVGAAAGLVAAVAGYVVFGLLLSGAQSDVNVLRMTCAPGCMVGQVQPIQTKLVVADVSLGLGIAFTALTALFAWEGLFKSRPAAEASVASSPDDVTSRDVPSVRAITDSSDR